MPNLAYDKIIVYIATEKTQQYIFETAAPFTPVYIPETNTA